jgi:acyl carrier protein
MHVEELRAQLRQFIEDTFLMGVRAEPLADDASFLEHHVLDSTGFLELIAFVEETYAIKVADDEMVPENLDSIDSLVRFVARKRTA